MKNSKYTVIPLLVVDAMAITVMLFAAFSFRNLKHQYLVLQTCDQARMTLTPDSVEQCKQLEIKYSIEYVCDKLDPNAKCNTEVR